MGEMADYYLDLEEWRSYDPEETHTVTCRRCGKEGLEWVEIGCNPTRWRLFEQDTYTRNGRCIPGKMHVCHENVADDFEVVG